MDVLKIYLSSIARTERISHAEEIELARRIKAGDKQAKNALVQANLRLAVSVAKHFQRSGVPLEDLVQAANIGLMVAAERYNPDKVGPEGKPYKFSTYATWWLKNYLDREIVLMRSVIKCSHRSYRHGSAKMPKIVPIDTDDYSVAEQIPDRWDPWEELGEADYREMIATKIRRGLMKLSERYRYVITSRMNGRTLQAISEAMGVTKERVRQIECRSFEQLREWLLGEAA